MGSKKMKMLLTQEIIKWQQTPQLLMIQETQQKLLKLYLLYRKMKKREKESIQRRFWVRPIFTMRQRMLQGASNNLIKEMEISDPDKYIEYLRMDISRFNELLNLIKPKIKKQQAIREPIPASTRLQICLRYLASGDTMPSISFAFRVGLNTVSKIVSETCAAIWEVLSIQVFPEIDKNLWKKKAEEFETLWNFPHCIGAIDGKHIEIQVLLKNEII